MHWLFLILSLTADPSEPARTSEPIRVGSALITLVEQVEIPAREAGVIETLLVKEGQIVTEKTLLAQIEDVEARLTSQRTKMEWDIARKLSENEIQVRAERKTREVAEADYKRARESVKEFPKSVSQSELDRLRLAAEKSVLDLEQAMFEFETSSLTAQLKKTEHELAERAIERRRIVNPLTGMVVQINRRAGEWVQPGEKVMRIVRLDRLRVEAFLNAAEGFHDLNDRRVTLRVDLPNRPQAEFSGKIVFVSPEINPVNGQVRVWAEVENKDLQLRPGLHGQLLIHNKETASQPRSPR